MANPLMAIIGIPLMVSSGVPMTGTVCCCPGPDPPCGDPCSPAPANQFCSYFWLVMDGETNSQGRYIPYEDQGCASSTCACIEPDQTYTNQVYGQAINTCCESDPCACGGNQAWQWNLVSEVWEHHPDANANCPAGCTADPPSFEGGGDKLRPTVGVAAVTPCYQINCSGSGGGSCITVACCAGCMPTTFDISINWGDCAAPPATTGTLTHAVMGSGDATIPNGFDYWYGTVGPIRIRLYCDGSNWQIGTDNCLGGNFSYTTASGNCDPFSFSATFTPTSSCCVTQTTVTTITITA